MLLSAALNLVFDHSSRGLLINLGAPSSQEEHERGLAHFVEHMAFKGTASYGTGELIKLMESLGIQYGQCLNASTGQDKTTYKLTVPLGGNGSDGSAAAAGGRLELALTVLAEFACSIRISDQDVETERAVIEEERRTKAGPAKRLVEAYWLRVFGEDAPDGTPSRHASRFPIGLSSVVQGAPPAAVREFYRKWYHPTLMAVTVAGDLNNLGTDEVVASVQRTFGAIVLSKAPILPVFPLPQHAEGASVCYHADPGLSTTQISIEFFEPLESASTLLHVRVDVTKRLLTTLVDHRLGQIGRGFSYDEATGNAGEGGRPFLWAGVSMRPIIKDLLCTGLSASVVESSSPEAVLTNLERGVSSLLHFSKRVACRGFNASEVEFAKHKWRTAFKAQLEDAENRTSGG